MSLYFNANIFSDVMHRVLKVSLKNLYLFWLCTAGQQWRTRRDHMTPYLRGSTVHLIKTNKKQLFGKRDKFWMLQITLNQMRMLMYKFYTQILFAQTCVIKWLCTVWRIFLNLITLRHSWSNPSETRWPVTHEYRQTMDKETDIYVHIYALYIYM